MMARAPVRWLIDCQAAVQAVTQALEAQGWRVYRSFDLRDALTHLGEGNCAQHGADPCSCQYAVLLVYGAGSLPAQIVAYGRDGQTWLSLLASNNPPTKLQAAIAQILTSHVSHSRVTDNQKPGG